MLGSDPVTGKMPVPQVVGWVDERKPNTRAPKKAPCWVLRCAQAALTLPQPNLQLRNIVLPPRH